MHILEHEHERLRFRELLRPLQRRPRQLLRRALALGGTDDTERHCKQVGDRFALATHPQPPDALFAGSSSVIPALAFTIEASGQ